MSKTLDLSKTIYELFREDPDILQLMQEAGFSEIAKPLMLTTAGRIMTLPAGAAFRRMSLDEVLQVFRNHDYTIINLPEGS